MKTKLISIASLMLVMGFGGTTSAIARDVLPPSGEGRTASDSVIPETFFAESLDLPKAADVYMVECGGAQCITADVNDIGPFNDTNFKVAINASSPGFQGNASKVSPKGGLSAVAQVCRPSGTNSNIRAYVSYTEVNAPGFENYDTVISCKTNTGVFFDPVITPILDQ